MVDSLIDLKQYAIAGASIAICIAVVLITLFLKGTAKHQAKKEAKCKKKEKQKEVKLNQKSDEKKPNLAEEKVQQIEKVNLPQEKVQQVEVVNLPEEKVQQVEMVNLPEEKVQQVEIVNLPEEKVQQVEALKQVESETEEMKEISPMILYFYKVHSMKKEDNKKIILENSITIGRTVGYEQWAITDDGTVSGKHCKIYQRNNELYMIDLNSTNGTYVNDKRVRGEIKLANHDKIRIGQSEYRIKF